jgi:hypothetical protein
MLLDLDPDPHSQYGSGSGSRIAAWMRIRIHNIGLKTVCAVWFHWILLSKNGQGKLCKNTMISYGSKNLFSFLHHQTVKMIGAVVFSALWSLSWIKGTASGELWTWETGEHTAFQIFFFINRGITANQHVRVSSSWKRLSTTWQSCLAGFESTPLWGGLFSALELFTEPWLDELMFCQRKH